MQKLAAEATGVNSPSATAHPPTANLQGVTVRQAAEIFKVSERMIYIARRLGRLDRPDLEHEVEAGRMSLHKALQVAEGRSKPSSRDRLVRAWNNATDADRRWLVDTLAAGEDRDDDHHHHDDRGDADAA